MTLVKAGEPAVRGYVEGVLRDNRPAPPMEEASSSIWT